MTFPRALQGGIMRRRYGGAANRYLDDCQCA